MPDKRIETALIGAGMIAKTHVGALSSLRDTLRLDAIISRRPERAHYLSEHYPDTELQFSSDLKTITENPDIAFVIVATPPSVRIELIETLAKAGKHILLEKPVARTLEESKQVVEICERTGVTLGIVFQHRMKDSAKKAAELIEEGNLGKAGMVEISTPLWRDQSYYDELGRGTYERDGGGVMITQSIHTIDLALSLAGKVSTVQAMTATSPLHNMESEDLAVAGLHFESGAVGSLVASTASYPHGKETIKLHYQNASLHLENKALDVYWQNGKHERFITDADLETEFEKFKQGLYISVINDFIQSFQQNREPMCSGREALIAHRLIEAIESSSKANTLIKLE